MICRFIYASHHVADFHVRKNIPVIYPRHQIFCLIDFVQIQSEGFAIIGHPHKDDTTLIIRISDDGLRPFHRIILLKKRFKLIFRILRYDIRE